MEIRDQHAQHLAAVQIKRYAAFSSIPERDVAGNILLGWERKLNHLPLTKVEADYLLAGQIRHTFAAIRAKTFGAVDLSEARLAVVIHLCVLMGVEAVRAMDAFWAAVRDHDYEAAAEEMLLSLWPRFVGSAPRDKERALDIVYMMRTGHVRPLREEERRQ